jgi:hypothetical protein
MGPYTQFTNNNQTQPVGLSRMKRVKTHCPGSLGGRGGYGVVYVHFLRLRAQPAGK